MTANTQTITCNVNYWIGTFWSAIITCQPVSCKYPPPALPANSYQNLIYSPDPVGNKRYQTTVFYGCPANQSLPSLLSSNFSFDYSPNVFVYNVTAICDIDGSVLDLLS